MVSFLDSSYGILSFAQRRQFQRNGFLAIHDVWSEEAVSEVRNVIDELFQSAGRDWGPLPNLVHRRPELRETAIFRSCLHIARQVMDGAPSTLATMPCIKSRTALMARPGIRMGPSTAGISLIIRSRFGYRYRT